MFKKKELQKVSAKSPEYQNFNDLVGNRPKDTSKIKLIQDSFESIGNFLYCLPIVVSEDGRIVDGQNRLAAARACNPQQDIYVVTIPNKDVAKVAIALNTNKKNWTLANFANYWSKQTDDKKVSEIYKKYLEYYEANNVTHGVLIAMFNRQTSRHFSTKEGGNKEFKEGRLPFGPLNRNHVEDTLSKLRRLEHASLYSPLTRRTLRKQQFQEALLQALAVKCFNFDKFLNNLCHTRHQFNMLAKRVDMYNEIMRIMDK